VSDLAQAHIAMVDAMRAGSGHSRVMNVGYGRGASVLDVLHAVDAVTGRPVPRSMEPRRPGDVPRLVADPRRIRAELGWQPRFDDLKRIVADAIAWERRLGTQRWSGANNSEDTRQPAVQGG
jgi:UDP-glucose 4-epimerase